MDTLIMCIGNRESGDDAIGPYIADNLQKEGYTGVVLDCGTTPENYTAVVKRHNPTTLILIDAADIGLPPGEIRIIPKEKIGTTHISTHNIPLNLLMQYLENEISSIYYIGIQPKQLCGKMSEKVKRSGDILVTHIKNKTLAHIEIL
jgi:hydrogenase 3 maturation protease